MGEQIERLAQFVAETQWDQIPVSVQQHAKLVLLDTLGVILAGAEQPEVQQLRARLLTTAGTGATVLARGWPGSDPRTAALLNGIAGRSIELCDRRDTGADAQLHQRRGRCDGAQCGWGNEWFCGDPRS
jgi:2-methylcitrate dehydratase PrpD